MEWTQEKDQKKTEDLPTGEDVSREKGKEKEPAATETAASTGLLHIYWGEGKGKTTAALGLSLRAAGAGRKVCFLQFLKGEGSGERKILRSIPQVELPALPESVKFVFAMNQQEKEETAAFCRELLNWGEKRLSQGWGLVVLDEVLGAVETGLLSEQELLELVHRQREQGYPGDLVFTGRKPPEALKELAQYSTEMVCHRHPYQQGLEARKGIEY